MMGAAGSSHRLAALLSTAILLGACGDTASPPPEGGPDAEPAAAPDQEPDQPRKRALVKSELWTAAPEISDPFFDPEHPKASVCSEVDTSIEEMGLETWFEVDTQDCAYATFTQDLQEDVPAGASLFLRIWHFKNSAAETDFRVALSVGEGDSTILFDAQVSPDDPGGLLFDTPVAPHDLAAGTPVYWHLSNHGENTWDVIEFSATF